MEKNIYKIYCDLDGVLIDFDKGYYELTGIKLNGAHLSDNNFWEPIDKAGYGFWISLEWMADGKKLWNYIEKYNPELLSAPSRQKESRIAKQDWVDKELPGFNLILRSAKHKKDFASPTSILIDDRIDNINSWREAGGIGILHKNTEDTISLLKELNL